MRLKFTSSERCGMIALLLLLVATLIILLSMRACSTPDPKPVEATIIATEADTTNLVAAPATTATKKLNHSKKQSGQRRPDGRSRRHLDERVD